MSIWSLKHPDFKNVIFEILEVSSCNSLATAHGRSALIWADGLCTVAGGLQEDTSRILRITFWNQGASRIKMVYYLSQLCQVQPICPYNLGCENLDKVLFPKLIFIMQVSLSFGMNHCGTTSRSWEMHSYGVQYTVVSLFSLHSNLMIWVYSWDAWLEISQ